MKNKEPLIHNEEMFVNILGISFFVIWLKGGRIFVLLMFIYFFICEHFERKKYRKIKKKLKDEGSFFA